MNIKIFMKLSFICCMATANHLPPSLICFDHRFGLWKGKVKKIMESGESENNEGARKMEQWCEERRQNQKNVERNCFFFKRIWAFFQINWSHLTLTLPLFLPLSLLPRHAASSRLIKRALVYVGHISAGVLWSVSAAWLCYLPRSLCFPPSREGIQYVLQGDTSLRLSSHTKGRRLRAWAGV